VEARFIANEDEIQGDDFNSEDHVYSVLGRKGVLLVDFLPQGAQSMQVSIATHKICDTRSRISDVARLAGVL